MAKLAVRFHCQSCGLSYSRWVGKCDGCGAWNSIVEEVFDKAALKKKTITSGLQLVDLEKPLDQVWRLPTGMAEFDRVVGGGIVPGASLLIGGDPGVGKSTLLLQVLAAMQKNLAGGDQKGRCVYVSGEESEDQICHRARRLGLKADHVSLASSNDLEQILQTLKDHDDIRVVVIDSIQTVRLDHVESVAGSVTQVRACTQALIDYAKRHQVTVLLVGHVTKEGALAGPRLLEHMVDTVLYFEGEKGYHHRLLRTVKNRFGPTSEVGVFEMASEGLVEISNPSALFMGQRSASANLYGTVIFAGLEGTRPLLVEIQALVGPPVMGPPRRTVVGWDQARLAMILAVLESRCGLQLSQRDVYVNIVGGLKIQEPAADLAVAAAVMSSFKKKAFDVGAVVFGEIGLTGEVRPVPTMDIRLREAEKLGFRQVVMPTTHKETQKKQGYDSNLSLTSLRHVDDLHQLMR